MSKTIIATLCLMTALAGTLGLGCVSTPVGGSANAVESGVNADGSASFDTYIVYGTDALRRKVVLSNVLARNSAEKTGGLTQTSVTLTNKTKKPLSLSYKFMWLDSSGFEITPDAFAWTPVTLQGLEDKTIQSVAPRESAVSFKVKVALR